MNKIDHIIQELNSGILDNAGKIQFGFMDGCPSDFKFNFMGMHYLAIAFGQSQSLSLKHQSDTALFFDRKLVQWKKSSDVYKKWFINLLKLGRCRTSFVSYILSFNDSLILRKFNEIIDNNKCEIRKYTGNAFYTNNGEHRVKLLKVFDKNNKPIDIDCLKFSVLLVWSEFIVQVYEDIRSKCKSLSQECIGLCIVSDFLSGNGVTNGDNFSRIIRAILHTAYPDQITFVNKLNPKVSNGENLVDNVLGAVTRWKYRTGNAFLPINTYKFQFNYYKISEKLDKVEKI